VGVLLDFVDFSCGRGGRALKPTEAVTQIYDAMQRAER
jgi:hypothetical protein